MSILKLERKQVITAKQPAHVNVLSLHDEHVQRNKLTMKIQVREFDISARCKETFTNFAKENYPTIPTAWTHEDIEFTALIHGLRLVGLMVAVPYDGDKMHIKFLAIAKEYRCMGMGSRLLAHIAAKYPHDEITLNITLDRLDLLGFYRKFAKVKSVVTEQNIMILSLC